MLNPAYLERVKMSEGKRDVTSLLVIVVDTNPVWWGQRFLKHDGDLVLSQCLDSIMVFANSHLMMNHKNQLAVIGAHTSISKFLYPKKMHPDTVVQPTNGEPEARGGKDGKYELFAQVDETILEELKDMVLNDTSGEIHSDSLLAGAMAKALCYMHRVEKEIAAGEQLSSRILVIKASEDNPAQYMNFMNVVFTSQKQNVTIDACILESDSSLLQQACDITGGIYLKIPQVRGILQYLLWVFLPDPAVRDKLTLPPRVRVDYRAACFCHRNLIEIGYVCSVCLSIFCYFSPICSTCQTTFKFLGPPKITKKKSRKSNLT